MNAVIATTKPTFGVNEIDKLGFIFKKKNSVLKNELISLRKLMPLSKLILIKTTLWGTKPFSWAAFLQQT